jgi:hypothetical protein
MRVIDASEAKLVSGGEEDWSNFHTYDEGYVAPFPPPGSGWSLIVLPTGGGNSIWEPPCPNTLQ